LGTLAFPDVCPLAPSTYRNEPNMRHNINLLTEIVGILDL